MTSDEMIRRLQAEFGDIGDITKFTPTAEQRSNAMMEGMGPSYGSTKGLTLNPEGVRQSGLDGTYSDPTGFRASLTPVSDDPTLGYGHWDAWYDTTGKMTGTPQYIKDERHRGWANKNAEKLMAAALIAGGGYALLPEIFGAGAGLAATEAALGELGINTALAAGTPGGIAAGTTIAQAAPSLWESTQLGYQSLKDALNVGQMIAPEAPASVQSGINRFATGLVTSGGDPEAAARSTLMGGVSDFINPYFAELPKEFQPIARAGVQTALQGGDLKGFVGDAIFGPINDVVSGIAGPTVAQVTSNAVKQAIATGSVDPANLTVGTIAGMVGQAVTKETGDASLGRAVSTTIRGAAGGNLDNALKQLAIGALTTPTKRG